MNQMDQRGLFTGLRVLRQNEPSTYRPPGRPPEGLIEALRNLQKVASSVSVRGTRTFADDFPTVQDGATGSTSSKSTGEFSFRCLGGCVL
ncbi:MAG: hypothetical protein Ct9H300mP15_00760 [Gemmatimonadota bacterium]|nr:MAG: hypothetical protein Ct9H300mP15_00760 [Gemmatimonadota bacterium]